MFCVHTNKVVGFAALFIEEQELFMSASLLALPDRALIERTLVGESDCFTVLMDRHVAAVRRRIKSMVWNPADQDEIVQETFFKAWRRLSSFRFDATFRTWIVRVAINEALQHRRDRCNSTVPAIGGIDEFASQQDLPDKALERSEERRTVHAAVAELPKQYRLVLILRDLDELTQQETAERLQFSVAAVKIRLFRARRMLSRAVRERSAA
jgi:RNA polymerase sigma-70 factor (ECF subfamily)